MRRHRLLSIFSKVLCLVLLMTSGVAAEVNSSVSRLVINEDRMKGILTLVNTGDSPRVVQLWVDDNNLHAAPEDINLPLVVSPPVFRLNPGGTLDARVILTSRKDMAQDRETLYWLNIYQIPPNTKASTPGNQLVLPVRIRLKILIRPPSVPPRKADNDNSLKFSLLQTAAQQHELKVENPTKYYITLGSLSFENKSLGSRLIPPLSSVSVPVVSKLAPGKKRVTWSTIDDYGIVTDYNREL